jgi:Protein of unknown function (DUF2695)
VGEPPGPITVFDETEQYADDKIEQRPIQQIMRPEHPQWDKFIDRLGGPEGCNFRLRVPTDRKSMTWTCSSKSDCSLSRGILAQMGFTPEEIEASLKVFAEHGGCCDCEILFNIAR